MIWNIIVLWTATLVAFTCVASASVCLERGETYKCQLGTKMPYRFIANYNDSQFNYPGCTEKKIWLLFRHGTRYPGKKHIPRMIEHLPKIRQKIFNLYKQNESQLSANEIDKLGAWEFTITEEHTMKLAAEGEVELTDLAERFQSRFPTLMKEIYSNQTYKFKFTATQRAEESAKHFTLGLFGRRKSLEVWYPRPEHEDRILRFYKRCSRWRAEVHANPATYEEKELFLRSKIFNETLADITSRLGFEIDYEAANLMYLICSFETAWHKDQDSPWCSIFSPSNFKVLEFAEDLQYYWVDGYGYRLTYEQACPALFDVFDFFKSDPDRLVSAYFTHSGTVLKFLAHLGLAKDTEPLKHNSFSLHHDNRAWRVSLIDAFASNIAFILYDCKSDGPGILLMHQERIVPIPGCPENIPCPMTIMNKIFSDSIHDCKFDTMCAPLSE